MRITVIAMASNYNHCQLLIARYNVRYFICSIGEVKFFPSYREEIGFILINLIAESHIASCLPGCKVHVFPKNQASYLSRWGRYRRGKSFKVEICLMIIIKGFSG